MESGQRYVGFAHSRLCAVPSPFLCSAGKSRHCTRAVYTAFFVFICCWGQISLSCLCCPSTWILELQPPRVLGLLVCMAIASPISFELKRNLVNILYTCVFLFSAEWLEALSEVCGVTFRLVKSMPVSAAVLDTGLLTTSAVLVREVIHSCTGQSGNHQSHAAFERWKHG